MLSNSLFHILAKLCAPNVYQSEGNMETTMIWRSTWQFNCTRWICGTSANIVRLFVMTWERWILTWKPNAQLRINKKSRITSTKRNQPNLFEESLFLSHRKFKQSVSHNQHNPDRVENQHLPPRKAPIQWERGPSREQETHLNQHLFPSHLAPLRRHPPKHQLSK